jgi:hypothetical protein
MMSHAAEDPYWKAKVRFEARLTPSAAPKIEDKCLSCHAPMQHQDFLRDGVPMRLDQLGGLGTEGVSCTVCHQVQPERLGARESFSGGFVINSTRRIFGPHDQLFTSPMFSDTSYIPEFGPHLTSSALCGTCHTVITKALDGEGREVGEFLEQAPFLEWLASRFPAMGQSCQHCHMPRLRTLSAQPASQYVAHQPEGGVYRQTAPRTPFGQHFLVGGNTQILGMLAEMFPDRAEILSSSVSRTRENLRDAVDLRVRPAVEGDTLRVNVQTVNRTGHKLPTGFPSRRMWLYLSVVDASGETLFESGAYDSATGEIVGRDYPAEPHHDIIRSGEDVMVYEAEMADSRGDYTVSVVRAAAYLKDNRIPPEGFDTTQLAAVGLEGFDLNRVGVGTDSNFLPGADSVTYEVNLGYGNSGPFLVTARAYFQAVKPTHLEGMRAEASEEEADFLARFSRHSQPALMTERIQWVRR